MRLFIAEKPDLARAIVDGLSDGNAGLQTKGNEFIKVGNDTVTWCFGHLLALKNPDEYDEKYKKWEMHSLPFDIPKLELKPIKGKENQVKIIRDLVKQADEIVNAGDPDEEGQLLVDELLEYFNNKKPVKRVLINDNTKASVQKSLSNLKDNKDFVGLRNSAYVRSVGDWKYGLNLTRAYTLKAQENAYSGGVLSVGRVQTPILNLVFERELEVKKHVKELYYNVITDNNFKLVIQKDKLEEGLCKDKSYLQTILEDAVSHNDFKIKSIEVKKQENQPPLPYNLLELQADANRRYKYKPDIVKDITQSLREKHKAITYNRSDCQYLTDEHYEQRADVLASIKSNLGTEVPGLNLTLKHKAFNNKNVSAHHAIIPTINNVDISAFSKEELVIYKMIADRYLVLFLQSEVVEKTSLCAVNSTQLDFVASTSKIVQVGFKSYFQKKEETEENEKEIEENNSHLANYKQDDSANFKEIKLTEHETKPKQLYTFATLLKDLTSVAKYVKNEEIKKLLQEKDKDKKGESGGIGTPATRDAILKVLIDRNFMVEEKGKLITSQLGKDFLAILPANAKQPDMTALWSEKQNEIKENKLSVDEFLCEIDLFVKQEISNLKNHTITISRGSNEKTSTSTYQKKQTSKITKKSVQGTKNTEVRKATNPNGEAIKCPNCNTGDIIFKTGQYGNFWACNNYPTCKSSFKDINGKPQLVKGVK